MARIRTIKPEFYKHERLYDAEKEFNLPLRLAYTGIWTCCDREGRFEWRPRWLKAEILPYDDIDFSRVLDALMTRGFLVKYEIDSRFYGFIPSWHHHQFINNKERPSELPDPNENNIIINDLFDACLTREPRDIHATSTPLGKVKAEGKGKGREMIKEKFNKKKILTQSVDNLTAKHAKRLSENFSVTIVHRELAIKNGWPPPDDQLEAFRDHHLSRGTVMVDWDRAFHTWLRNALKFDKAIRAPKTHAQPVRERCRFEGCHGEVLGRWGRINFCAKHREWVKEQD